MKVTEHEIIDVLLGDASPEVTTRVQNAVRTETDVAELYAKWGGMLGPMKSTLAPVGEESRRVTAAVAKKLPQVKIEDALDGETLFPTDQRKSRWWNLRLLAVAAAIVFMVVTGLFLRIQRNDQSMFIEEIEGRVAISYPGTPNEQQYLEEGEKVRYPVQLTIGEGAKIRLVLADGTILAANQPASVVIREQHLVEQFSGTVRYRAERASDENPFTVLCPHGEIVDLGTEFEVTVEKSDPVIVDVDEGRVRLQLHSGTNVVLGAGERGMMNATEIATDHLNPPPMPTIAISPGTDIDLVSSPKELPVLYTVALKRAKLAADSNLISMISTKTVQLHSQDDSNYVGKIPLVINDDATSLLVEVAPRRDLAPAIIVDENGNGTLDDDRVYVAYKDFTPGDLFPVTFQTDGQTTENIWIRLPIEISQNKGTIHTDRLEYVFPIVMEGTPTTDDPEGKDALTTFCLIDRDMDGRIGRDETTLMSWMTTPTSNTHSMLMSVGPANKPLLLNGYEWSLQSLNDTNATLVRKPTQTHLKPIRVGERLPLVQGTDLNGAPITLKKPDSGYLMIFIWSSLDSLMMTIEPAEYLNLYDKFDERGLEMVGVCVDNDRDTARRYANKMGITCPSLFSGSPNNAFGITQTPYTIIVDATGTVVSTGQPPDALFTFFDTYLPRKRSPR